MEELVVASVYAPTSRNPTWLKLQKNFLDRTTSHSYHFVVALNHVESEEFAGVEVIYQDTTPAGDHISEDHAKGLAAVLDYFRKTPARHYLVLDSDAFPVQDGWFELLLREMGEQPLAAIVRFENLDTFPHPSAFFFKAEYLDRVDFSCKTYTNFLGRSVTDVGCGMAGTNFMPLIRSNARNYHPILGGVYHDLFYHHGCGSRLVRMRSIDYGYYGNRTHIDPALEETMFQRLRQNPIKYIQHLRSWASTGLLHQ